MPDQELTAQERAALAAQAAAEARRAAARHAARRRAEQDVRRRSTPSRRPPGLAPKAGLAFRGDEGTTVDPARAAAPVTDTVAEESQVSSPTIGRQEPPAPRRAAAPVRTAPVPDDRSGTFSVARLTGADAGPRAGADEDIVAEPEQAAPTSTAAAADDAPTLLATDLTPTPRPRRSTDTTDAPAPITPLPADARPAESSAAPAEAGAAAPAPAPAPAASPSSTGSTGRTPRGRSETVSLRTGSVTGLPTELAPLPDPPSADRAAATAASGHPASMSRGDRRAPDPADSLELPLPPRTADGQRRQPDPTATDPTDAVDADAPGPVSLATVDIDVALLVPDETSTDEGSTDGPAAHDPDQPVDGQTAALRLPQPPRRAPGADRPSAAQDATVDLREAAADTSPLEAATTRSATATPEGDGARPWVRSYPPGVPDTYRYPLVPVTRFLDDAAQDFPDTAALTFLGTDVSYRQLSEQVDRLGSALTEMGLGAGGRVAVALPWCPQLVTVLHACWRVGADAVVLDPDAPADVLADGIAATGPSVLVLLDSTYPALAVHRERLGSVGHVITTNLLDPIPALRAKVQAVRLKVSQGSIPDSDGVQAYKRVLSDAAPTATQTEVDVETTAAITTVTADGPVSLTHHNLLVGAFQARLWLPDVRAGKESLVVGGSPADPFTLGAGLTMAMLAAATLVLPEPRDDGLARTIDDVRPTLMVAPVEQIRRVLAPGSRRRDLTSLRVTLAGGLAHDPAVRRTMQQRTDGRMRICLGAPTVAAAALAEAVYSDPRLTSAALPPPDGEVRIVRPDSRGVGEVEVGGPHVTGGWTPLGLVGTIDDAGFVEVVGSADTVIAHAGGVTDPQVLTSGLRRDPGVADAVVHTEYRDDTLHMLVEVSATDPQLTPQRLQQILAEQAPTQSPPTEWRITAAPQAPAEPPPPSEETTAAPDAPTGELSLPAPPSDAGRQPAEGDGAGAVRGADEDEVTGRDPTT